MSSKRPTLFLNFVNPENALVYILFLWEHLARTIHDRSPV